MAPDGVKLDSQLGDGCDDGNIGDDTSGVIAESVTAFLRRPIASCITMLDSLAKCSIC